LNTDDLKIQSEMTQNNWPVFIKLSRSRNIREDKGTVPDSRRQRLHGIQGFLFPYTVL
jgi:hypothetical protein